MAPIAPPAAPDILTGLPDGWSIADDHEVELLLCADLESLADRLPALPPLDALRRLTGRLDHARLMLLPRAERRLAALPALAPAAALRGLDLLHAADLVAALWEYAARRPTADPARLGYMLRCYFDGRRRAIALEKALLGLD